MEDEDAALECLERLHISEEKSFMTILVDGTRLDCDKEILVDECDYFKALKRFDSQSDQIELKGEIEYEILKCILDYLVGGQLDVNLSNFQPVLQGCQFLQCARAEEATVAFISRHLAKENVFSVHRLGRQLLCGRLVATTASYIAAVFGPVLSLASSRDPDTFLAVSVCRVRELVRTRTQVSEELLVHAVLAWLEADWEERGRWTAELMEHCNLRLFSSAGLAYLQDEGELLDKLGIASQVAEAVQYKSLRLDRKISFWEEEDRWRGHRWPGMVVIASSGSSHASVQCCQLGKLQPAPVWKSLAKKPAELKKASTGSCMVYCHPRLYFLGGEKNWYLHWFDLETSRWGAERGVPPTRLLSGGCVLGPALYLVGGVTLEEWEGVAGGGGAVAPSAAVDRFDTASRSWQPCADLELGRSSPGTAALGGRVWVFGGLRRREMVTSCCCYHPDTDTWTPLASLPDKVAYFSLVTVGDTVIWLLGGLGQDYTCRKTTYKYDTRSGEFTRGPDLNKPRKGAFSFVHDDKIYVCGGSVDGMKYLDTLETLDLQSPDKWREQQLNLKNFNSNLVSVTTLMPVRFLPS